MTVGVGVFVETAPPGRGCQWCDCPAGAGVPHRECTGCEAAARRLVTLAAVDSGDAVTFGICLYHLLDLGRMLDSTLPD